MSHDTAQNNQTREDSFAFKLGNHSSLYLACLHCKAALQYKRQIPFKRHALVIHCPHYQKFHTTGEPQLTASQTSLLIFLLTTQRIETPHTLPLRTLSPFLEVDAHKNHHSSSLMPLAYPSFCPPPPLNVSFNFGPPLAPAEAMGVPTLETAAERPSPGVKSSKSWSSGYLSVSARRVATAVACEMGC